MFEQNRKYFKLIKQLKAEEKINHASQTTESSRIVLDKNINVNLKNMESYLSGSSDVVIKQFKIGINNPLEAFICIINGLTDQAKLEGYIKSISTFDKDITKNSEMLLYSSLFSSIKDNLIYSSELKESQSFPEIINDLLSGNAILFVDGYDTALVINIPCSKERNIEEAYTEMSVRGSHEGFVENIGVNMSLIRKIIVNPNLVFEMMSLGKKTHTKVCIAYIKGTVNEVVLNEVKKRLDRINSDSILESGYIEQFITDSPLSCFSTIGNSEKPDKVAAKLLEGKVAILCNGTPFVLTVPHVFIENFQGPEDYFSNYFISLIMRLTRFAAFFITLAIPALYIAITTFHPEMVPSVLLLTFASARESIPFPAFVETLLMLSVFELLRESGIKMPKPVGQSVSIVGALIIGQSAVEAGLVGAPMVMIIGLTAISSFIVTPLRDSIIFFRLVFILLSAMFGLFGFIVAQLIMIGHMCSLKSFGIPYLTPFAPTVWRDLKDTIMRPPFSIYSPSDGPKSIQKGDLNNPSDNDKGSEEQ